MRFAAVHVFFDGRFSFQPRRYNRRKHRARSPVSLLDFGRCSTTTRRRPRYLISCTRWSGSLSPEHAVETGTWLGRSAVAIASALRENGFGHLISLESDSEVAHCAMSQIRAAGLSEWVEIIAERSLNFQPRNELQFALLDSEGRFRAEGFRHFYEKLAAGATVVLHYTGSQHEGLADAIRELIAQGQLAGSFFPTPRGIFAGSARRPPESPATTRPELSLKIQDLSTRSSPCKRAAILVLGVHRSGTSSLAHLLNVLGAKLPEKVMGPAHSNPLGQWGPMRLMEINEEILAAMGPS